MTLNLYATDNVPASIRKAHDGFSHVMVNCGYTTIKPVFFDSSSIDDLPVYIWAWWDRSTDSHLVAWRASGGVLLDRYTFSDKAGEADVLVFVECPLTMKRLTRSATHIVEYSVIPRPHTWRVHEQCVDLRTPSSAVLQKLWAACRGARLMDAELAEAVDLPKQHVMYMRKGLKPVEEWQMKPRLAPEFAGLADAWKWIGAGRCISKKEVREAGHKAAILQMARLGHIVLEKYQRYPEAEPDWERLERKRNAAITDLAAVRSLVESLPDHLQA